jgi:hypothetical protein
MLTLCDSGGSEDVMLDLMIRQLVKNYQRKTNGVLIPGSAKTTKL